MKNTKTSIASYGWAVFTPKGQVWLYAVGFLRKHAIREAEKCLGEPWEKLRARGYSVRRVVVREAGK